MVINCYLASRDSNPGRGQIPFHPPALAPSQDQSGPDLWLSWQLTVTGLVLGGTLPAGLRVHPSAHYSHSIVLSGRNALIQQRQTFPRMIKNRFPDPSEICALEFNGEISPIRNLFGFSDYRHRSVVSLTPRSQPQAGSSAQKDRRRTTAFAPMAPMVSPLSRPTFSCADSFASLRCSGLVRCGESEARTTDDVRYPFSLAACAA
jgi:hypothetical protein